MRLSKRSEPNLAYDVKITDSALLDAQEYVQFIQYKKREPRAAERWFHDLLSAIFSLEELPSRYGLIPEASEFSFELRHLIVHSHRIIYRIDEADKSVKILRIYHGSCRRIRPADLEVDER